MSKPTEVIVQDLMVNPDLADRMTSADLKRVSKMMAKTLWAVGRRAEEAILQTERMQIALLEITGGQPPEWSYIHANEALRLPSFSSFNIVNDNQAWVVCGEEDGVLHPIYEYDLADFGTTIAEGRARSMLAHLRQTFQPRINKEITA